MFARNVSFHLKSNMLSDYTRAVEKDVLHLLRKQNGFKDDTNTYPQVLKMLARFIEGTPQVHTSDVVTSTLKQHELVTA